MNMPRLEKKEHTPLTCLVLTEEPLDLGAE